MSIAPKPDLDCAGQIFLRCATNRIACTIFAVLNHEAGRGPARLRRLVWDQEIAGSNPAAPTTKAAHSVSGFFVRENETSL